MGRDDELLPIELLTGGELGRMAAIKYKKVVALLPTNVTATSILV
jgi:hypothetical protein